MKNQFELQNIELYTIFPYFMIKTTNDQFNEH